MSFGLKYVRVQHPLLGDTFFMFSKVIDHKKFVHQYLQMDYCLVLSAGFSDLSSNSDIFGFNCFGRSSSLEKDSKPEDSSLATSQYLSNEKSLSYLIVDGHLRDEIIIAMKPAEEIRGVIASHIETIGFGTSTIGLSEFGNPVFRPLDSSLYKQLNYEIYETMDTESY